MVGGFSCYRRGSRPVRDAVAAPLPILIPKKNVAAVIAPMTPCVIRLLQKLLSATHNR